MSIASSVYATISREGGNKVYINDVVRIFVHSMGNNGLDSDYTVLHESGDEYLLQKLTAYGRIGSVHFKKIPADQSMFVEITLPSRNGDCVAVIFHINFPEVIGGGRYQQGKQFNQIESVR